MNEFASCLKNYVIWKFNRTVLPRSLKWHDSGHEIIGNEVLKEETLWSTAIFTVQ